MQEDLSGAFLFREILETYTVVYKAISPEHNGECSIHVKEYELGAPVTDSRVSIFGTAPSLLRPEPKAYVPQVISIRPYHHKRSHYYALKLKCALESELSLDYPIRACYIKVIPYSRDELSQILALDTSFISLLLKSICRPCKFSVDTQVDHILESIRNTPLWYAIEKDIVILENQVPKFVLIQAFLFTSKIESDAQVMNSIEREISRDDGRIQELNHLAVILHASTLNFAMD
ncbi:hypothetical protein SUGI_0844130 [Cryptomeria japonica]|nr:hypothetical protein SUGI_0844130 [Cryptomeria japonica]